MREPHRLILARRTDIGELLALEYVHLEAVARDLRRTAKVAHLENSD
jgi:hypothetical protein